MKNYKNFVKNIFILIVYLSGLFFLISGFYKLSTDECKELEIILKKNKLLKKEVIVKTFSNKTFKCKIKDIKCRNHLAFLNVCGKEIRLDSILKINDIHIYKEVSDKISKKGITGITLIVIGGFLIIIITILKDYF